MAAITAVEIDDFRCFHRLRVDGLTQVNLIVGANNSGKTALLEAIEAVASAENPFLLYRASFDRNEYRRRRRHDEDTVELDVRHWFHGHRLHDGASFGIRASGERTLEVARRVETVPRAALPPFVPGGLQLTMTRVGPSSGIGALPLFENGLLGAGSPSTFMSHGHRLTPPVGFVTTDRLVPRALARLWTRVVLTPGEGRTIDAMRLIEPAIDRIAISESDDTIAKVLLRGAEGPVPLGSLGEGVSRTLALALQLALTKGGFLLLDEIENGLHWSVMPKVWRFLVETAVAQDVQVFATTHSKDWLDGLADLHRSDPALAAHVCVHRLEAGRETSIRFDAERIADYVAMELEAR
jgi:hypothetical protein